MREREKTQVSFTAIWFGYDTLLGRKCMKKSTNTDRCVPHHPVIRHHRDCVHGNTSRAPSLPVKGCGGGGNEGRKSQFVNTHTHKRKKKRKVVSTQITAIRFSLAHGQEQGSADVSGAYLRTDYAILDIDIKLGEAAGVNGSIGQQGI